MLVSPRVKRWTSGSTQRKYRSYSRSRAGTFFLVLIVIIFGCFTALPLLYCLCTSLKPLDELLIFPPKFFVRRPTFENFLVIPSLISNLDVPLGRYFFNSLWITVVGTFLHIVVASMAAYVFAKGSMRGRNFLFIVVQLSLLYNGYTLEIPRYLIYSGMHILDSYLVYILPVIPSAIGCFLMKQYMESSIPDALLEAARIDGATFFRTFWSIAMPAVKPAWMTLLLFSFQGMWSTIPGGTIFSEQLKTLPYVMAQIVSGGIARAGSAMATTVILMIPPLIVYFITQSRVMETMSSAGIKE